MSDFTYSKYWDRFISQCTRTYKGIQLFHFQECFPRTPNEKEKNSRYALLFEGKSVMVHKDVFEPIHLN